MPRRGDNIRKRKDGRWEARYIQRDCAGNQQKYRSIYGKTYQEVKEKREQTIVQNQKQTQKTGVLFSHILAAWQASNQIRLKAASVSRYQNLIDVHILPELGNKRMEHITAASVNHFLNTKLENGRKDHSGGLSPAYIRSIAQIISSAIAFGAAENMCSPLRSPISKPAIIHQDVVVLCAKKQTLLEKALLSNINEVKLLIYITLYTGIRIGEACALRWEDIDLDTKVLHIGHTISRVWITKNGQKQSNLIVGSPKTKSSLRSIPICSKLYTVLCSYPFRKTHGFVLANATNGGFISPRTFEYRYKAILKSCAIEPFHFHLLRHTFATRCIERGVDIKTLSEILGHANVSITLNTYVHTSMEQKHIQIEKLTE